MYQQCIKNAINSKPQIMKNALRNDIEIMIFEEAFSVLTYEVRVRNRFGMAPHKPSFVVPLGTKVRKVWNLRSFKNALKNTVSKLSESNEKLYPNGIQVSLRMGSFWTPISRP